MDETVWASILIVPYLITMISPMLIGEIIFECGITRFSKALQKTVITKRFGIIENNISFQNTFAILLRSLNWPQEIISLLYPIVILLTTFYKIWLRVRDIDTRGICISTIIITPPPSGWYKWSTNTCRSKSTRLMTISYICRKFNERIIKSLDINRRLLSYCSGNAGYKGNYKIGNIHYYS